MYRLGAFFDKSFSRGVAFIWILFGYFWLTRNAASFVAVGKGPTDMGALPC